jgi:hypothetical protein
MNCPNCGAENEADAFFCVACGEPLESQDTDTIIEEQSFGDPDDEPTILSSRDEIFAQMQSMASDASSQPTTDQESGGIDSSTDELLPLEPGAPSPPPGSSVADILAGDQGKGDDRGGNSNGGGQNNQGNKNRTLFIVIGVIVVLLLLCCCCSVVIGSVIASNPEIFEEIGYRMSLNIFNDSQTLYPIQSML